MFLWEGGQVKKWYFFNYFHLSSFHEKLFSILDLAIYIHGNRTMITTDVVKITVPILDLAYNQKKWFDHLLIYNHKFYNPI